MIFIKQLHSHTSSLTPCTVLIALLVVLFFPTDNRAAGTEDYDILLVLSANTQPYTNTASSTRELLDAKCNIIPSCINGKLRFNRIVASEVAGMADSLKTYRLIVTFGKKAAITLRDNGKQTGQVNILHAMIPRETENVLLQEDIEQNHYVLLLDQPIERQFALIKAMFPGRNSIGILLSSDKSSYITELQKTATQAGLNLELSIVQKPSDIGALLDKLVKKVDLFLIIPDKSIYNRNTIKEILLTGYFHGKPFIGYSNSLTRSGALASVITDKKLIANDIAHIITDLLDQRKVAQRINYPSSYQISINSNVADSLGIQIPDEIANSDNVVVTE